MITILTTIDVRPGREEDFEELWRQARPKRLHYPGLRTDQLLRDTDQPGRYVVFDEWEERAQFDAFVRASGMLWRLDATEGWVTPLSWSYLEDVEEAAPASRSDSSARDRAH